MALSADFLDYLPEINERGLVLPKIHLYALANVGLGIRGNRPPRGIWIFPVSVPNALKSTGRGHFHRAIFVSGLYTLQEISTVR
jgi:hypothetical protein